MRSPRVTDPLLRDRIFRRALRLEFFTLLYNLFEAGFSIFFARAADSIALLAFGLDSLVESFSGAVLILRLSRHGRVSELEEESLEKRSLRLVAVSFLILGGYVVVQSARKLLVREIPDSSWPGVAIAAISLLIMPLLGRMKRKAGEDLGSEALIADSRETLACSFLSAALLLGLGANLAFGFWQADALAGLAIAAFLFREGREAWELSQK
jgi:divalent metal cation (Fe/Co/Zn/Cd) transporter